MKTITKNVILGFSALAVSLAVLPMFAAFEAHVINVTARIENALNVPLEHISFGTVFPQEHLNKKLGIELSSSFLEENRVDDVEYIIRQKPKCGVTSLDGKSLIDGSTKTGHVIVGDNPATQEIEDWYVDCGDAPMQFNELTHMYGMLPMLCPYISKHPDGVNDAGELEDNDTSLNSFHMPFSLENGEIRWLDTKGRLAKSDGDVQDLWTIDLAVPCFGGHCAQDWGDFVRRISEDPQVDPDKYTQPEENEHKIFGCDLWVEVTGISLPGLGCEEELDMMLVLDRSGSINSTELQTVKDAANAFVTALAPTAAGVHIGQTSFADAGSLDLHLTDVEASVHAAINALVSGGFTNLQEGINLATDELDDAHAHERAAVSDVMVIITDGNPNRPPDEANARALAATAADAARAAGIEVYVVGVGGDVDATYLMNEIADDAAHYFAAADFDDLEAVLEDLVACNR